MRKMRIRRERKKDTQKEVGVSTPVDFGLSVPGEEEAKSLPLTPLKDVTQTVRISVSMEPIPTRQRRKWPFMKAFMGIHPQAIPV